jgi:predicted RNase H-like nuclease (RuvC/YqgF family)
MDAETIKDIIKHELPNLIKNDESIKEWILELSNNPTPKNNKNSNVNNINEESLNPVASLEQNLFNFMEKLKSETESKISRLQANYNEIEKIRQDIADNQLEIERLHRLLSAFDRKQDISLGSLQMVYGY